MRPLNAITISPFLQLDQHIEEVCPKTKMICEFEYIGCTHRVSLYKLVVDDFFYSNALIEEGIS